MRRYRLDEFRKPGETFHIASYSCIPSLKNSDYKVPEHCHDFGEFFFVPDGEGLHRIDGADLTMRAGDLWYIRPDDVHGLSGPETGSLQLINIAYEYDWARRFIHVIGGEALWKRLHGARKAPCIRLAERETGEFARLLHTLPLRRGTARAVACAQALAAAIGHLASTDSPRKGVPRQEPPEWLNQWRAALAETRHCTRDIVHAHKLAGCSREYLARLCRQHFGETPTEILLKARIRLLQQRLLQSPFQLAYLAGEVGFNNLGYCHRVFKRQLGCTPEQWRRQHEGYGTPSIRRPSG